MKEKKKYPDLKEKLRWIRPKIVLFRNEFFLQLNLSHLAVSWVKKENAFVDILSSQAFFKAVNFSILNELPEMVADEPGMAKIVALFLQKMSDLKLKVRNHRTFNSGKTMTGLVA